jgi:hypothetical protein
LISIYYLSCPAKCFRLPLLLLAVALQLGASLPAQAAPPSASPTTQATRLTFFAWGDWGDTKSTERQQTADTIANFKDHPDLALLLGDNFYFHLTGPNDPRFKEFFEDAYASRLNVPFYALFGNHDYSDHNIRTELTYQTAHPDTRFHLPAPWYRLDLPPDHPLLTLFMLDSNHDSMDPANWQDQIVWLATQLRLPRAKWTICCGHHNMFGNGNHGDNGVLQTDWGTLFKKYHVDFYLCGHEHTLQHLEIPGWPTSFIVSGGGGAGHPKMLRDQRGPFSRSVGGFAEFIVQPDSITVRLVDTHGTVLHQFTRDANGKITVTINTPSDRATDKPLEVIQGLDKPQSD